MCVCMCVCVCVCVFNVPVNNFSVTLDGAPLPRYLQVLWEYVCRARACVRAYVCLCANVFVADMIALQESKLQGCHSISISKLPDFSLTLDPIFQSLFKSKRVKNSHSYQIVCKYLCVLIESLNKLLEPWILVM